VGLGQRAVVWTRTETGYLGRNLDPLPGHTATAAVGVDNLGRVVGWSYHHSFGGPRAPFVWTKEGGMVDLTALGAPRIPPLDVSPAGIVLHIEGWYSLDDPADDRTWLPAPPQYLPPLGYLGRINDAGVQAIWLRLTSGQEHDLAQIARYDAGWNLLSPVISRTRGQNWIGGINNRGDIAAQVLGRGIVYFADEGERELTSLLPASHAGVEIYRANDIDDAQRVTARAVIGNGTYAVKLLPAQACTGNTCIRSSAISLTAKTITPDPGRCVPGAYTKATAKITVTNRRGRPIPGAAVTTSMFNTLWDEIAQTATTSSKGVATFKFEGECGGGTVSILVTNATLTGKQYDATAGIVVKSVIPS
jgi:hypothetical protein